VQRGEDEILDHVPLNGSHGCETRKEVVAAQGRPDDALPPGRDGVGVMAPAGCFHGLNVRALRKGDGHAVNPLGGSGIGNPSRDGVGLRGDRPG